MPRRSFLTVFIAVACLVFSSCSSGSNNGNGENNGGNGATTGTGSTPGDATTQNTRFQIVNQCQYTIWIQQQNMPSGVPAVTQLTQGQHVDFDIPDAGLASTRFWPKTGCDNTGQNCVIGQSSPPCPTTPSGCSPPVDSKIEVTWGCTLADQSQCGRTPQGDQFTVTFYNSSAVDGYTLPFNVHVAPNGGADCVNLDCGDLLLSDCPTTENLSVGNNGSTTPAYSSLDLQVKDPDKPGTVGGCFSPCKFLDYPGFGGEGLQDESGNAEALYCCPTPPISSAECRAGPVPNTEYVQNIHKSCTGGVYGYAYDDGVGLHTCSAPTNIQMVFGPNCP